MPSETLLDLVLALAALVAGVLYLRARRRRSKKKKAGPAVRPATPSPQPAGAARGGITTWAPPAGTPQGVAPTMVVPQAQTWEQPATATRTSTAAWSAGAPAPAW